MRQGYKTTEFWITILIQIIGVFATTGLFTPEQTDALSQAAIQVGGIVAMVASAFGYTLSRGKAKSSTPDSQAGFVGTNLMAVILITAIALSGLYACSILPGQVQESKCATRGDQFSWICDKSEQLNITPESAYGVIFASTAAATIIKIKKKPILERQKVCDFLKDYLAWFEANPVISYAGAINKLIALTKAIEDAETAGLVINILNRNLVRYSSTLIISKYDRSEMIIVGLQLLISDLLC